MKIFALCLGRKILVDRWGDLISSTEKTQIEEWHNYNDFVKNGAKIKEILVYVK